MIGSFWNLCRACPSMPVDKLHSEYRSTYRWHEYTGNSRPEVVRKPPVFSHFGLINEPPLPRRKKCPELAYKTHEFIGVSDTSAGNNRARSEERGAASRRSQSEGPLDGKNFKNEIVNENGDVTKQTGESNGLFKKTISKLSTEYRLQFVWPNVRKAIKGPTNDNADYPRKSLSMNAIKSSQSNVMPTVHKKRTTKEKEATLFELEPLVNGIESGKESSRQIAVEDLKSSQNMERERYNQFTTKKENYGFCEDCLDHKNAGTKNGLYSEEWYKEVIELRKKADEYKCRGWGTEIDPDLYKKQKDLWDQVSKRSSLSALSLASSIHRPTSKEEKDKENNQKSFETKPLGKIKVPGHVYPLDNKSVQDGRILPARVQTIRHHLERTTGPDVEEGALLPSPTREKLMPVIPREKDDSYNSQKSSPKKKDASRHGSPQKGSPQKGSPKKISKGRSQSVGPAVIDSNESPKRQVRTVSTAPDQLKNAKSVTLSDEKRPRPSSLSTSFKSRSKSSSSRPPNNAKNQIIIDNNHQKNFSHNINRRSTTPNNSQSLSSNKTSKNLKHVPHKSSSNTVNSSNISAILKNDVNNIYNKNIEDYNNKTENDDDVQDKDKDISGSPQLINEISEHIVKSPPEPTRVKSPEQILMRSPDPVNWTVPLDTGKTFTVTQNVKDGEFYNRPQSEVKASTPVEKPPPAPQSAPPELTEQCKMEDSNFTSLY